MRPPLGRRIDWAHPLARGMAGFWLFNEKSGDRLYDLSNNGNDGILTSMDPVSDWVFGEDGPALDFDQVDDYINAGDNSSLDLIGDSLTIEVRFKGRANPSGWEALVGKRSGSQGYSLELGVNHVIRFATYGVSDTEMTTDINAYSSGEETHIVAVYDGAYKRIYVNGVLEKETAATGNITTSASKLGIASLNGDGASSLFDGSISRVRVYSKDFSEDEAIQLYAAPYQMFKQPIPLAAYAWPESQVDQRWVLEATNPATSTLTSVIYTLVLTGAPDGESDLTLPISSFQGRLRDLNSSWLSCVVPNARQYAADINLRPNGEMVITRSGIMTDGSILSVEIARVDLEEIREDKGSKNSSCTLSGHKTLTPIAPVTIQLQGVSYRASYGGKRHVRAQMDSNLRPWDRVEVEDEIFYISAITYMVNKVMTLMEITEA